MSFRTFFTYYDESYDEKTAVLKYSILLSRVQTNVQIN